MQEKNIEPLVSLVIVLLVFCASLFVILQGELALDKQLTASVFQPKTADTKPEINKLLVTRAREQVQTILLSGCINDAYDAFKQSWNQECEKLDLEDKCNLPRYIADGLKEEYQESQGSCYK